VAKKGLEKAQVTRLSFQMDSTYNMTRGKFEAKLELLPAELVVHVLRKVLEALNDDGNLN
jgi:hypothetical protein